MFYITVILLSDLVIILSNAAARGLFSDLRGLLFLALSVIGGTVAVIALDGAGAFIIRWLIPARFFAPDSTAFAVGAKEQKIYRRLKINAWKDRVPELGVFTGFDKGKFESSTDVGYLGRFLVESNYGVVIHLENALLGPLICLLPFCRDLWVWLPIAAVNFVLSLLPVAVLRYNTRPLRFLYERGMRKTANSVDSGSRL